LTLESGPPAPRLRLLYIVCLTIGLAAATVAPLAGMLFIILSLTRRPGGDPLGVSTIGVSMAAVGLGIGGLLAWAGRQGMQGRSSAPFNPRVHWLVVCLVGLGLALPVGQLLISFDVQAPITFPPFHVAGISLSAALILVLVGRGVQAVSTQRQVIGQLATGALGATLISFALEAIAAAVGLLVIGIAIGLTPDGPAQLNELRRLLNNPQQLQDTLTLAQWFLKPAILLPVAITVTIIAPMIEEAAKSLGVPLLALWTKQNPTPGQGWLWGITAGIGFGIAEGLMNSAVSLSFWAGIILLRASATLMHATTTGLIGLGWARTLTSRRPWPLLGNYLASVALHGLWNGMTVLMAASSLWSMSQSANPAGMMVGGIGLLIGLAGWGLTGASVVGVLTFVTLRVRESRVGSLGSPTVTHPPGV
jgi:hypothetical protein